MKKTGLFALLLVLLAGGFALAGENINFLAPDAHDLLPSTLTTSSAKSLPNVSMDAVSFCWPLKADKEIALHQSVTTASSREYRLVVPAAQLQAGVEIPTTAPGALIRLNPAGSARLGKALSIDPKSIVLVDPQGKEHFNGNGMLNLADAEALKAADAPFAEGTSAFRIDPVLGSGSFKLVVPNADESGSGWVVNVLEKDSPVVFELSTDRNAYLQGQKFRASFDLRGAGSITQLQAELHSPSGRTQPVHILAKPGSTSFVAIGTLNRTEPAEGLWEIHATVRGSSPEGPVIRDVHTAFAMSAPTARFLGRAMVSDSDGLVVELPVEVGSDGRYSAEAVLFGTDAEGEMYPLGICQSADYLTAGTASLSLHFEASMIDASGLHAPFEIRDLQLKDQGRMGEISRQARALVIK